MKKVPISDFETPITYFANPYLQCTQAGCKTRVVGIVGIATATALPTGRNWPCYHLAARISICSNWTSTTGCQHTKEERAAHTFTAGFEGTRR